MLAFKAEEGPEGPDRRTEDRAEERVLGGELGAGLARTEGDAAMERRVRAVEVEATAVDVVALDKLCWEGTESGSWSLTGLYRHLSSCRLTLSDRLSPLRL